MRKLSASLVFLLFFEAAAFCEPATLKQLLVASHVPAVSFGEPELAEAVEGMAGSNAKETVAAYFRISGGLLVGPLNLLSYNKASGSVLRSTAVVENRCAGAIVEMRFIGSYTVIATNVSPSAECLLVLGGDLKLRRILYGFAPLEVAPDEVVIVENMVHFAPAHSERLELDELESGVQAELYPVKGDRLREYLIAEHGKHMPDEAVCAGMNDPCDPKVFDEDIQSMATDGRGRLAFLAFQSASHAIAPGESTVTVASQNVFYLYERDGSGWRYCEQKVDKQELADLNRDLQSDFSKIADRCQPTLAVVPDTRTAN